MLKRIFSFFKKIPWKILIFIGVMCAFTGLFTIVGTYLVISHEYADHIATSVEDSDSEYAALILGAGVRSDGSPSSILKDRVQRGVELYKAGKVKKLIMSGDNRFVHYNEPDVMVKLALDLGVPQQDVFADYAGRRTYDSCWRAKHIFSQDRITIVSQSFHITRAMFVCEQLGIHTQAVKADISPYAPRQWAWWTFRDMISLLKSVFDIYIWPPKVIRGEKITL
jgi:SanA protein